MSQWLRKDDIAARFSQAAPVYAKHARLQQQAAGQLLELFRAGGRVADIGCGSGRESLLLAARAEIAEVMAVDIAPGMLACIPGGGPVRPLLADAERLPLPARLLDGVFSNFALQWCAPEPVCRELHRVLRPRAPLAISVPGPDSLAALRLPGLLRVNRFAPAEGWTTAMAEAGFTGISVRQDWLSEYHPDALSLLRALKAIGANSSAEAAVAGLRGRRWLAAVSAALERQREPAGLPLRYEVIYLTAQAAS